MYQCKKCGGNECILALVNTTLYRTSISDGKLVVDESPYDTFSDRYGTLMCNRCGASEPVDTKSEYRACRGRYQLINNIIHNIEEL